VFSSEYALGIACSGIPGLVYGGIAGQPGSVVAKVLKAGKALEHRAGNKRSVAHLVVHFVDVTSTNQFSSMGKQLGGRPADLAC
jgi:hypothetical protein